MISAGTGSVTEDVGVVGGNITTGGTLTISDADSGEASFTAQTTAGAYGSFTLATNGVWTYTASNTNPAIQALGTGDTLTETFTVTSADGTTSSVVVTINGTNDAAVISAGTGSVTEDVGVVGGNITTGGTLTISDADGGEASFTAQTAAGAYGSFTLAANGVWTYTASNTNPAIQALGSGDTLTETFTVASADGTTSSVVVTINGTNDAAVISAGTGSVTEDVGVVGGNITTGGTLTVSDADSGEASFTAQTTAGTYGSFTLATNGAWTYTASNTNPAIQALGTGDTLTETFTVTSADGTTSSVVVSINGTNDGPVAQANALSTDEDTALTIAPATLLANDSDVDGDTLIIASVQDAANGTVALVGGNVVFTPAANYSGPASFTYTVSDGNGGTSTATVNLTINPVNDLPTANADTASTAINTALPSIAVLANDSDADGDTLTVTSATLANPALGSVSINPDGTLAFTPALNVVGPVTINYTISDGHGGASSATLSVNVGANNAPTGADATITIAEDGSRSFTAADFGFADVDLGQTLAAVRIDALPAAGTLTLGGVAVVAGQVIDAADFGQLVFAPAPNASGTAYAGFTFSVQDSAGAFDASPNSITVNVTPAPDVAVISGVASGATVEDTTLTAAGQLLVSDPDTGEAAFQPQVDAAGTYGNLTIDAGGAWTYTLNNANPVVQSLGQGESRTETFTVRSIDGTPQLITITVTGTNDAAVISAGAGSVTEDTNVVAGNLSTGGTLTVADLDAGEATFTAQTTAGAYGSFTLAANGVWTYTASNANPAIQALGNGDTLTETFTVTSADGTTSSVVVTINGTNDAAVISAGTGSVTEDVGVVGGNITTGGTLTISDADSGEASFTAQTTAGAYGNFTLATNGVWTYTAPTPTRPSRPSVLATRSPRPSRSPPADGTTSSVVVTINGTNDAAVISAGTGSVTEDVGVVGGNITTGGTLTVTDADSGEASFTAQATAGTYGSFTLGTNGAWTYTASNANPAIQALGAGDTLTETFTVTSADGTTSSVVVTINGTNDAAVISAGTGSVTEDVGVVGGNITTGGTLTISDADAAEATFTAQTHGRHLRQLHAGRQRRVDLHRRQHQPGDPGARRRRHAHRDLHGHLRRRHDLVVVVTINGTNDAAVISSGTGSVTEDVGVVGGNIATGGTLTISDADTGEASLRGPDHGGCLRQLHAGHQRRLDLHRRQHQRGHPGARRRRHAHRDLHRRLRRRHHLVRRRHHQRHQRRRRHLRRHGLGHRRRRRRRRQHHHRRHAHHHRCRCRRSDVRGSGVTAGTYGTFTLAANGAWTYTARQHEPGHPGPRRRRHTHRDLHGHLGGRYDFDGHRHDQRHERCGRDFVRHRLGHRRRRRGRRQHLYQRHSDHHRRRCRSSCLPGSGFDGRRVRHLHARGQWRVDLFGQQRQPGHPGTGGRRHADRNLHGRRSRRHDLHRGRHDQRHQRRGRDLRRHRLGHRRRRRGRRQYRHGRHAHRHRWRCRPGSFPGSGLDRRHLRQLHAGDQRRMELFGQQCQPGYPGTGGRRHAHRDLHRHLRRRHDLALSSSPSTAPTTPP